MDPSLRFIELPLDIMLLPLFFFLVRYEVVSWNIPLLSLAVCIWLMQTASSVNYMVYDFIWGSALLEWWKTR